MVVEKLSMLLKDRSTTTKGLPGSKHPIPIVSYLHACFAWEFSNTGSVTLGGGRILATFECDLEGVASRLSARPILNRESLKKLNDLLQRHLRGTSLVYGVFPLQYHAVENVSKVEISPLFLTELEPWEDADLTVEGDGSDASLMVNRALLDRVIADSDKASEVGLELQKIVDTGPLNKSAIALIESYLVSAIPAMQFSGFEIFPFCTELPVRNKERDEPVEAADTADATEGALILYCSAVVLLTRRSKQSMGILHELGQMQATDQFSPPVRQLSGGHTRTKNIAIGNHSKFNRTIGALSPAQMRAVRASQQHDLSVVFGPPGCGKTHTLAMIAANTVASGGTVLICARNPAAVDVIIRFLDEQVWLGGAMVNGGSRADRQTLKRRLQSTVQSGAVNFTRQHTRVAQCLLSDSPLTALKRAINKNRSRLTQLDRQMGWLERHFDQLTASAQGQKSPMQMAYLLWARFTSAIIQSPLSSSNFTNLNRLLTARAELLRERDDLVREAIQLKIQYRTRLVLKKDRRVLSDLADSFTAREFRQRQLQQKINYPQLLATMPVWVTTLSELSHLLPFECSLFDLVIVDEASQADMASGLPALQRARRAVILGDTEQLRHVSFLPIATEHQYMQRYSSSMENRVTLPGFRQSSLLDWANANLQSSNASQFLDEHFRSAPAIIEFSNRTFYQSQLKLLTHVTHRHIKEPLECIQVKQGRQHKNGHNPVEAQVVVAYLKDLLESNDEHTASIAVLSPYRAQCDHLQKQINKLFSKVDCDRCRLLVGTAHELQGEERDIVLMSSVVDNHSPGGSIAFLSRNDVMNVSITRARRKHVLFLSRDPDRFDPHSLFGQYIQWLLLEHKENTGVMASGAGVGNDDVITLCEQITRARRIDSVDHGVKIGDIRIDILLNTENGQLGVDLIGFPQANNKKPLTIESYAMLSRTGLSIIPVSFSEWAVDPERIIQNILQHPALAGHGEND